MSQRALLHLPGVYFALRNCLTTSLFHSKIIKLEQERISYCVFAAGCKQSAKQAPVWTS